MERSRKSSTFYLSNIFFNKYVIYVYLMMILQGPSGEKKKHFVFLLRYFIYRV